MYSDPISVTVLKQSEEGYINRLWDNATYFSMYNHNLSGRMIPISYDLGPFVYEGEKYVGDITASQMIETLSGFRFIPTNVKYVLLTLIDTPLLEEIINESCTDIINKIITSKNHKKADFLANEGSMNSVTFMMCRSSSIRFLRLLYGIREPGYVTPEGYHSFCKSVDSMTETEIDRIYEGIKEMLSFVNQYMTDSRYYFPQFQFSDELINSIANEVTFKH